MSFKFKNIFDETNNSFGDSLSIVSSTTTSLRVILEATAANQKYLVEDIV